MGQTVSKQPRSRQRKSEAREVRDIAIYQSHMAGNSVRTIQNEFSIKSTQTVHLAIGRGKELVKERGIDLDDRRIEIDQLFNNTLGHLAGEIQRQADEGRIQTIDRSAAEALARSADRWAQFLGITDRANEVNQQATVIQLSAPADGASFTDRWSSGETVDVTPSGPASGPTSEGALDNPSQGLDDHLLTKQITGANEVPA